MLSDAFARLRTKYPEDFKGLDRLEQSIEAMLRKYHHAVIDVDILQAQTEVESGRIYDTLVALVGDGAISRRLFWICPNESGTIQEADSIKDFPLQNDCPICGDHHNFDKRDVEVGFLSAEDHLSLPTHQGER